ncbi:MAG: proline dehydrogenase family protein [Desulfohalobiaceae bacterium]|nr:proline dehydrogenase family protein [Desulfohalobiaceae bacterium]
MATEFESRVKSRGLEIFGQVEKGTPSLFKKDYWTGKVMDWAMKDEAFKVQMFRFVDVFPYLNSPEAVAEHIQEYFCRPEHDFPKALQFGLKRISPNSMAAKMAAKGLSSNIRSMGKQFIVGNTLKEAAPVMKKVRDKGVPWVMKILKEEVKSVREEEAFVRDQIQFFDEFAEISKKWPALGQGGGELDWGDTPKCVMSVMVSSLYAQYMDKACAFDHSVKRAKNRLRPILRKAQEIGACLILDMEHLPLRELTLATYKSIMEEEEFAGYPHTGIVYQAYLRDAETPLEDLLQWSGKRRQPMHIRLVKGAFWDEEVVRAHQNNVPIPVFTNKYETDAMFERLTRRILENHNLVTYKCASHNIRSIAFAQETANDLGVPKDKFEIQMLYGMAENLRTALVRSGYRLRLYAPIGEVIPGMAYLVRRLLENTSNESFLRQSFKEGADKERLLANPAELSATHAQAQLPAREEAPEYGDKGPFLNEPPFEWTAGSRQDMARALEEARSSAPRELPLHINGQDRSTRETFASVNPNNPEEVLGQAASAGKEDADEALAAARAAFPDWSRILPGKRSECLFRAAEGIRRRRHALAAMDVLEIGKNWNEAQADVNEAIDFLEYYGREMIRLSPARSVSGKLGEDSRLIHEPRGVAVVIAPYNMALPISVGTLAAALVTGNSAVYKPAPQAPVLGFMLAGILRESGLPDGVLNVLSGQGEDLPETLAGHPETDLVAFTGGEEAGRRVLETAAQTGLPNRGFKKTVLSLVGKNAIIMDSDADLDAAVSGVVGSAFGYQGQKCSACSRLIVLKDNYDKVLEKVKEAADSLDMGPVEDPRYSFGAVIDEEAQKRVEEAVRRGRQEAELVLEKRSGQSNGYTVPLAVFAGIGPEHRLARENVFGPVLSVIRVKDFDQALEVANSIPYALTGGVYSRNPANIERAYREFKVGNLYINRGITGALVGRHPFGGFRRSGDGSKAGGPDYLKEFMVTRTIIENTFRSGFAPLG